MVCRGSTLISVDNSGFKRIYCLRTINNSNKIKSLFRGVLKKKMNFKKLQKKRIYFGLIISLKQSICREDGFLVQCDTNAAILLNNSFKMLGSRIFGPIFKEVLCLLSQKSKKIDLVKRTFYRSERFV
jgi:ribosomal protein L14